MTSSISGYIRRHHLGLVAIFIALTGTAWAGAQLGPKDIRKNAIRAKHVKDGKLGTKDIADGTTASGLSGADVVPNGLSGDDVDEGTLFNDDSLDGADVAEATLFNDDSLDAQDIAGDAIGSSELGADAAGSGEIATGAVGASEVADNSIGSSEVADNSIGSSEIANSGIIDAYLEGDFATGRPPSAIDPNTAFMSVNDDVFGISRATQGGGNAGITFDADTLETSFNGAVDINGSFLEIREDAPVGAPPADEAWLYLRENGGSELVVEWPGGTFDVLAQD